jgi:hypothetical protein
MPPSPKTRRERRSPLGREPRRPVPERSRLPNGSRGQGAVPNEYPDDHPVTREGYQRKGRRPKGFQRTSIREISTQEESERSWRLAIDRRFRANEYMCGKRPPSLNPGPNLFPPRRSSYRRRFSRFNGTHGNIWDSCSPPTTRATRRCPVKPNTPLGPDQANVLLLVDSNK